MTRGLDRLGFVRSRLVRHSAERAGEPPRFADDPDALLVLVAGDRIVLREASAPTALLEPVEAARAGPFACEVFLGRIDGRPVHAAALAPEAGEAFSLPEFQIRDLRAIAMEALVSPDELGLVATAKSLLAWHARHGFCANCGAATLPRAGGFRRECPSCGAQDFPRTDPVAIMLVTRGDACLLGRAPHFREGMYSCLAGFIEPGETIEDAVRRETFEEAGIRVGEVRYLASQPWPFPSSVMIGCVGQALDEAIAIDPAELADARWFGRDAIDLMIEGRHPEGLCLPPPMAIAHHLLLRFLDGAR